MYSTTPRIIRKIRWVKTHEVSAALTATNSRGNTGGLIQNSPGAQSGFFVELFGRFIAPGRVADRRHSQGDVSSPRFVVTNASHEYQS